MDNVKTSGRAALKTIDEVFHESLEAVKSELNNLHSIIRIKESTIKGNEERIKSDGEFIEHLQAQIKILCKESYELKAERDQYRAVEKYRQDTFISRMNILFGFVIVTSVIGVVASWL